MSIQPLQVSFRVVGLYCYFENLQLPNLIPTSTVKEVMDAVQVLRPNFNYQSIVLPNGKQIVDTMSYIFTDNSTIPYNASGKPADGPRSLTQSFGATSLVWQYYRSVTGTIDGVVCEIKLISKDQASFATRPLNFFDPYFGALPPNFIINTYNLTWRLVQLEITPEKKANFMMAKAQSLIS